MDYVKQFGDASANAYLLKSREKTEQQKRLEEILDPLSLMPSRVADIACGAGNLSYHLSKRYRAKFVLSDLGDQSIALAKETAAEIGAEVVPADIYDLPFQSNYFDLVFCWQTLLCIDNPEKALQELVRICKPGGRVFASSLFNHLHDVDLYTRAYDHTRKTDLPYNTYCHKTVRGWVTGEMIFHDFSISTDLSHIPKGVGTYTTKLETGERLQISGGMLMSWQILEVRK